VSNELIGNGRPLYGVVWLQVTPERYMKTVHAMQPELFVVMADEVSCWAAQQ
jgi:hypothetical protein